MLRLNSLTFREVCWYLVRASAAGTADTCVIWLDSPQVHGSICKLHSVLICLLLSLRFVGKMHKGNILLQWILNVQEYCLGTVTSQRRCTSNLPVIIFRSLNKLIIVFRSLTHADTTYCGDLSSFYSSYQLSNLQRSWQKGKCASTPSCLSTKSSSLAWIVFSDSSS